MNARLLFATGPAGLTRAVLADGEWKVDRPLEDDVRCVAVDPNDPRAVFAGTQGRGVFRSIDGGASWDGSGLDGSVVKALAVSPHDSGVVYAGLKPARMAVSRDGGASWEELDGFRRIRGRRLWFSPAEPPGTAYVQGIALSPEDPDVIVAGIEFGAVVRSTDGGRTWSGHRKGALRDCHSIRFHATDGTRVYEGGYGMGSHPAAVSRDGGETWERPKDGIEHGYGWACAADPEDADTWYVSAASGPGKAHGSSGADAHIYRRRGSGPWERLRGGLPDPLDAMPYALHADPSAPGHLYAGLSDGAVWFSADHGDSWRSLPVDLGRIEREMVVVFEAV